MLVTPATAGAQTRLSTNSILDGNVSRTSMLRVLVESPVWAPAFEPVKESKLRRRKAGGWGLAVRIDDHAS